MGAIENRPYIVSWNLTKRCNLLCPHCYLDCASDNGEPELSRKEANFVMDGLSCLNSRLMLVLSGGEPLLREDIFEIVEYASKEGFITVLGSNGTLLTGENIRMLRDAGLKGIGVSIDSPRPSYHDSFRGLEGAWELSVNALIQAREEGIETQIDVSLTDANCGDVEDFVEFGAEMGARAVNFFFLVCTGRAMKTDISTSSYETALRRIARISSGERRLMVRARCAPHIYRILYEGGVSIPGGTRGCLAGRHYMRIDPAGNVTPCPYMSVTVGNIREQSLTAIWEESPYLKALREGKYGGRCGLCEYAEICGGCRARAMAEKGSFMEEDSLCSYVPSGGKEIRLEETFKSDLKWDENAKARILKVPFFMQGMIIGMVESVARKRGMEFITPELIDELKARGYGRGHGAGPGE